MVTLGGGGEKGVKTAGKAVMSAGGYATSLGGRAGKEGIDRRKNSQFSRMPSLEKCQRFPLGSPSFSGTRLGGGRGSIQ